MILNLCLFGIQCACVQGLVVVCIFAMFNVLHSRVCASRTKGTISKIDLFVIIKAPLS